MHRSIIQRIVAVLKGEPDYKAELEHYTGAVSLFRKALITKQNECERLKIVIHELNEDQDAIIELGEQIMERKQYENNEHVSGKVASPYMREMFGGSH